MNYENLAIIPARGGSKGIPKKNIKLLAGKPLIQWTIEHALNSSCVSRLVVSTDCEDIADISTKLKAEVPFLRPNELSSDTASTESAILHCLEWLSLNENYQPDNIILLQPTSPIRSLDAIDNAFDTFLKKKADSLLSVSEFFHFLWEDKKNPKALYDFQNRPRRQDIEKKDIKLKENGSIYISTYENVYKNKNRLGGKIETFIMDEIESLEIDTDLDFKIVETILGSL